MSPSRFLTFFLLLVACVCFLVLWWKTKLFEQIINGASLISLRLVLFFGQKFTDEPTTTEDLILFLRREAGHLSLLQVVVAWQDLVLESSSSFTTKTMCLCVHHHHGFSESSRKIIFWWKKNINPITDSKLAKSLCHQATQGLCKKSKSTWCFWLYFLLWKHESTLKCQKQVVRALVETPKGTCFFPLYSVLPRHYQFRVINDFERMPFLKHLFYCGVIDLWKKLTNAKNR